MAIPSPSVKPLKVAGTTHTYVYEGMVEQSGVAQDLNIDLTEIPISLREGDPKFQDTLFVQFRSLDDGLTAAGPPVPASSDFHDDGAEINAYLTIQITSDLDTRLCLILVEPRHSIGR